MTIRTTLLALIIAIPSFANAQDSLFYTNGKVVVGYVEELGLNVVRYRIPSEGTPVVVTSEKQELHRIRLASGQEFIINPAGTSASDAFLSRTHAVSLDFLAPALGHAVVGYEQAVGKNMSLVVKAGYIGIGNYRRNGYDYDYSGAMLKLGVNFFLPHSQKRIPSTHDQHPLAGWYLRPELSGSFWHSDQHYNYYYPMQTLRTDYSSVALNMVIGRKVILGERFTFDIFGGLGYGAQWRNGVTSFGSNSYNYNRQEYSYSHAFLGNYTSLTCTGGMMFGYLF